jgi:hypothetical protein
MERGKSLPEFILSGRDRAIVSITLHGFPTQGDVTITLTILQKGGMQWRVNGVQRSDIEVKHLMASYSIQMSNPVMFLPQASSGRHTVCLPLPQSRAPALSLSCPLRHATCTGLTPMPL